MGITKKKKRTLKARSARLIQITSTGNIQPQVLIEENFSNHTIEEDETVFSSQSEYIPSQLSQNDSCFQNILDQLFAFLIENFGSERRHLVKRNVSALLCLILKHFDVTNVQVESLLNACNLLSVKTSNFWLGKYSKGDFSGLELDGRCYGRLDSFYDIYPDIEHEARTWAIIQSSYKSSNFSPMDLANFITNLYKKEPNAIELDENELIRSESSCRGDLIKWGFYLGNNSNRPYFEGHEREDVVKSRKEFVSYFADREHLYWQIENDPNDKNKCDWITPMRQENGEKRVALFSHDESTNKRGEVSKKNGCFLVKNPYTKKEECNL